MNNPVFRIAAPLLVALACGGGLILGGCSSTPTTASAGENVDDTVITGKVKAMFVEDKTVAAHRISVETFKGVVQLSGFAKSTGEIRRAGEIAWGVKGVKSVKNDIRLRAEG